jgi:hypothetical protein
VAIRIVKNSVNKVPPPAQRRASRPASSYRQQPRRQQRSSGGGAGKAIAAVIIVMVLLGIVIIAATSSKQPPQSQYHQTAEARTGNDRKLEGLDSLGGMTMGEWQKLHNKDNAALKARKARMRKR